MDTDDHPATGAAADPPKSSPTRRKKGTAMKKATKSRGGGAKRGKKTTSTSTRGGRATATAAAAAAARRAGKDGGSDGGSAAESDNGPYCICRGPDDHRWMISCDLCDDWFHGECVDVGRDLGESLVESFVCPNCTDGRDLVTRYKLTCSLPGCRRVAGLYGSGAGAGPVPEPDRSRFCSPEHAHAWWEQLVASLPDGADADADADSNSAAGRRRRAPLTRAEFMGLLVGSAEYKESPGGYKLGEAAFSVPKEFWADKEAAAQTLTEEETAFLQTSAQERYGLAEEIVMCKHMLRLLDLVQERRAAAVAAGKLERDACGYDVRLDTVGVVHAFAAWLRSGEADAVLQLQLQEATTTTTTTTTTSSVGLVKLGAPVLSSPHWTWGAIASQGPHELALGMCERRRCKPHGGWAGLWTRDTKHRIKELAREAAERLGREEAVREAAAMRARRKVKEDCYVEVHAEEGPDGALSDGMDVDA